MEERRESLPNQVERWDLSLREPLANQGGKSQLAVHVEGWM
jgi:hypothetical protein